MLVYKLVSIRNVQRKTGAFRVGYITLTYSISVQLMNGNIRLEDNMDEAANDIIETINQEDFFKNNQNENGMAISGTHMINLMI